MDPANRLATDGAAETCWLAMRLGGRFIAPRPVAQRSWKKNLLRDHAPPQLREDLVFAAQGWRADGAPAAPGRVGLSPHHPGAVWPVAWPPASDGPPAGIRGSGNNAGSSTVAGTFGHSLCAGRSGPAGVADWHGGGSLDYHHSNPQERNLPRASLRGTRKRSPRAHIKTQSEGHSPVYTSVHELDSEEDSLRKAWPRRR